MTAWVTGRRQTWDVPSLFLTPQDTEREEIGLKHRRAHFFTKHIATLWDSLPSGVIEAKTKTGDISPIHRRKGHRELLNTNPQIGPLGQEVLVQRLPGARRMRWRECERVLAPSCTLLWVSTVQRWDSQLDGFLASCSRAFLLQGTKCLSQNLQSARHLSHIQHPSVP